jgi:hypothetical protein
MLEALSDWIDSFLRSPRVCIAKRLSGNDTLATNSHQAGPYLPKTMVLELFPELDTKTELNPRRYFAASIDSHQQQSRACAIYYNNRFAGGGAGTRNETRLTGFGGRTSPLLDPESTGAIAVFSFDTSVDGEGPVCRIWVARSAAEEELIEQYFGLVEPGRIARWPLEFASSEPTSCWLAPEAMPAQWLVSFPSAAEIVRKSVELRAAKGVPCDQRLLRRRDCEYEIFRSVEQAIEMPAITKGFTTIEQFLEKAQTLLQRRKARSGRSLELQTRAIFIEENLQENADFSHQPISEAGKRPDFLFPSQAAYQDPSFPADKLKMLAVKTTCRDRWRQVINEADRIPVKHLLTLQEGVSETQFEEMSQANVQLVVPEPLVSKYPKCVRPRLLTLGQFIRSLEPAR